MGSGAVAALPEGLLPIRFSSLRLIGTRSPAHVAFAREGKETVAMERGSAVHAILLETLRVTCYPGRRAGKAWESFALENADALILTEKEHERAAAMVESVRRHPLAMRALEGQREQRLEWEMSGLPCRGTPDVWCLERVVDLKTTRSSKPDEFERYAVRAFYPAQLAWYGEGLRILGLADPQEYLIVAVESEAPYPTTVFRLTERALEDGAKKWRLWFERLKVHIEAGIWPGYSEGVEPIDVPEEMPEFAFADEAEEAAEPGSPTSGTTA